MADSGGHPSQPVPFDDQRSQASDNFYDETIKGRNEETNNILQQREMALRL